MPFLCYFLKEQLLLVLLDFLIRKKAIRLHCYFWYFLWVHTVSLNSFKALSLQPYSFRRTL